MRRFVGSLGMSLGAIALMAACGPGEPVPALSPGPSPAATAAVGASPSVIPPELPVIPLPGVASAPPGTTGPPEIVVRSRELKRELDGWWRLEGRLINAGERPAREVGLTLRVYDAWGVLLDTREAVITPDRLDPAQEGRYVVTWPPQGEVASLTLEPHWVFRPD